MRDTNVDNCVGNIKLEVDITSTFSLAAQQNAYPVLKSICISYPKRNGSNF